MKGRSKKVYLAGPINGKTDEECMRWRALAAEALWRFGHEAIDPMVRDYRGAEDSHAEDIVSGDKEDIESCDVVLVNANSPSWGTAMEVVYAISFGKTVIAFATPESAPRLSPWLVSHTHAIYQSLSHALAGINQGSNVGRRQ